MEGRVEQGGSCQQPSPSKPFLSSDTIQTLVVGCTAPSDRHDSSPAEQAFLSSRQVSFPAGQSHGLRATESRLRRLFFCVGKRVQTGIHETTWCVRQALEQNFLWRKKEGC